MAALELLNQLLTHASDMVDARMERAMLMLAVFLLSPVSASDGPKLLLDLWQPGDEGQRLLIRGRVSSESGQPIANATVYFRQADGTGVYTGQYQGSLQTKADGSYTLGTVMPGQYTSEKHIHVFVDHIDYQSVNTDILFKGDPNLASGVSHNEHAIVTEEATIKGVTVLLGEFNIVMRK